jgi:hypothetical protein
MNNKLVYSYIDAHTIAAGAVVNQFFSFNLVPGDFKLKSITWQLDIAEGANGPILNLQNNTTQGYRLYVGLAGSLQSYIFDYFSIPGAVTDSGNNFYLKEPGQYFFDGIFIRNRLNCEVVMNNTDALIQYIWGNTVIFEIEQI